MQTTSQPIPLTVQPIAPALLHTPLHALHLELGARMVPFAGYSMPVQYPVGLVAEHLHTRNAASLFDVSHMGQLRVVGPGAATALESLMPMDVIDLPVGKQRYGLLLNAAGGIIDDLMFCQRASDVFIVVNGACKAGDIAHMQAQIGARCQIVPMPEQALLALQGPLAVDALSRLMPGVQQMVFMDGAHFTWQGIVLFITRSGYTGEDGFEISLHQDHAQALARALLTQNEVLPAGLGARNSLRLEAGLCLYGQDIDQHTSPIEAGLMWAVQKVRRSGGVRAGGFPCATKILANYAQSTGLAADFSSETKLQKRVGLLGLERTPVREGTELHSSGGQAIGRVTSGLPSPSLNQSIAMGYVNAQHATVGTIIQAIVRGKAVPMQVCAMPFVPTRYYRGV